MPTLSAGLLPFRRRPVGPEVLLGHMGGPFWARKEEGACSRWSWLVGSGSEVKLGRGLGEALPAVDLAQGDLA